MAWIQQSAAAHRSRTQAIWAQGDASMQSYYDRMDSMDHTQRDFLNCINFGDAQLRAMGLNPSDYEQVTVVK